MRVLGGWGAGSRPRRTVGVKPIVFWTEVAQLEQGGHKLVAGLADSALEAGEGGHGQGGHLVARGQVLERLREQGGQGGGIVLGAQFQVRHHLVHLVPPGVRRVVVLVVGLLDAAVDGDGPTGALPVPSAAPVHRALLAVAHLVVAVPLVQQCYAPPLGGHVLALHAASAPPAPQQ